MDHSKAEISQDYKEELERYRNMQLPPCPKCSSSRTAIVKCGIGGISLYLAANTPKLLLRPNGMPGKYYCRECKSYFNDNYPIYTRKQIHEAFKQYIDLAGVTLSETDVLAYSKMFFSIENILINKIQPSDMFSLYDELSDYAKYNVPEGQKMKAIYDKLTENKITASVLDEYEKKQFAFCIWYGELITVEGKNGEFYNGMHYLTTPKAIKKEYENLKDFIKSEISGM